MRPSPRTAEATTRSRLCVSRCLDQLRDAEASLRRARGALSELDLDALVHGNINGRRTPRTPRTLPEWKASEWTPDLWKAPPPQGLPLAPRTSQSSLQMPQLREHPHEDEPDENGALLAGQRSTRGSAATLEPRAPPAAALQQMPKVNGMPTESSVNMTNGASDGKGGQLMEPKISLHAWYRNLLQGSRPIDQIVLTSIGMSVQKRERNQMVVDGRGPRHSLSNLNLYENDSMQEQPTAAGSPTRQANKQQQLEALHHDVTWHECCFGGRLKIPVLHPEANPRVCWMFFGFLLIVYEMMAIPVMISFDLTAEGGLLAWGSIINIYFLTDICLNFIFGYIDKNGEMVVKPARLAKVYLRTWFLPDVVASIPWEWISMGDSANNSTKITRGVRVVRSLRMLRLLRLVRVAKLGAMLGRFEARFEANPVHLFAIGVIRVSGMILAIAHWSACVWYAIGRENDGVDNPEGGPASWIQTYQTQYPFIGDDKMHHYVFSLYFCITTMTTVGYGDISPKNYDEVRFAMALLVLSSICFANLMGALVDMLSTLNRRQTELQEKKVELSRYMSWRKVPWKLTMSIRQHLMFVWDANQGYDEYEETLKVLLSPVLKQELCHHIYGPILTSAPFLAWMKDYPACMRLLSEKVKAVIFTPGDEVFRMGQVSDNIFMLQSGECVFSRIEHLFDQDAPRTEEVLDASETRLRGLTAQMGKRGLRKGKYLSPADLEKMYSDVFKIAAHELAVSDYRRQLAAQTMQRRWREKVALRVKEDGGHEAKGEPMKTEEQWLRGERMHRRKVKAPAYFGESCLWQPFEEWGSVPPPAYLYTLRCESRVELASITRADLKDVIDRFKFIPERLQIFREVVLSTLESLLEDDKVKMLVQDWAVVTT